MKNSDNFLIVAQNKDCRYPQSMSQSKHKKTMFTCTLVNPNFYYIKVGCKGVFITRISYIVMDEGLLFWQSSLTLGQVKRNLTKISISSTLEPCHETPGFQTKWDSNRPIVNT